MTEEMFKWLRYYMLWGILILLIGSYKLMVIVISWITNKKLMLIMKWTYYRCLLKLEYFKIRNKLRNIFAYLNSY